VHSVPAREFVHSVPAREAVRFPMHPARPPLALQAPSPAHHALPVSGQSSAVWISLCRCVSCALCENLTLCVCVCVCGCVCFLCVLIALARKGTGAFTSTSLVAQGAPSTVRTAHCQANVGAYYPRIKTGGGRTGKEALAFRGRQRRLSGV
jgi:hypothetical protein